MKHLFLKYCTVFLMSLLALSTGLSAAVTVKVKAGMLKDANGSAFPTSGLILVAVDGNTNSQGFSYPSSQGYQDGDDYIVGAFDLSATNTPGLLIETLANIELGETISAGDAICIYWFPTMTLDDYTNETQTLPSPGTPFGFFAGSGTVSGSAPWVLPPDGGSITLEFLTDDANFDVFSYDGEAYAHAAAAGKASLTIDDGSGSGDPTGNEPGPTLFANDAQVVEGSDWYNNEWLGNYNSLERPWYYHDELGFVYIPADQTEDSLWMWSAVLQDWIWTHQGLWPYAYQLNGDWLFHENIAGTNYFYRFNGESLGWN